MVARLAPLDLSGYIAGQALAARLTAQAGEATGAGYAQAGQNLAAGITKFSDVRRIKKERKEDQARDDTRFQQTRQDRLAEQAIDNARQNAQLEINAAERSQATIEVALGKIEKEKQNRLIVDPNSDLSDLMDRQKTLTNSHAAQGANKSRVVESLHAAAHPECPPGGT